MFETRFHVFKREVFCIAFQIFHTKSRAQEEEGRVLQHLKRNDLLIYNMMLVQHL